TAQNQNTRCQTEACRPRLWQAIPHVALALRRWPVRWGQFQRVAHPEYAGLPPASPHRSRNPHRESCTMPRLRLRTAGFATPGFAIHGTTNAYPPRSAWCGTRVDTSANATLILTWRRFLNDLDECRKRGIRA